MKRTLLTIVCVCVASLANAQIAKWLIEPLYDNIHMASGIDAILTDSANTKTLWSYEGKRLATTTNEIFEFRENLSVSTVPGTANIACVFKSNGESIKIANCNVAHAYPYYSCGKLLVQEGMYYRFVSVDGSINGGKYTKAYPYFNGYASCQTYLNMEKQKDPYLLLVNKNEEMVQFSYNGKNFGTDDVEFISSVNDENLAIVVIKHKLYKFNGTDGSLSPVFASEDETNLKNQAKIDGDLNQCYSKVDENTSVLTAKCGKSGEVSFEFDNMLKPVSFAANGDLKKYSAKIEEKKEFTSPLRMDTKGNLYGIYWDSEEMLPAQFDKLSTCFDNKAFVQLKGKYGMLAIDKDAKKEGNQLLTLPKEVNGVSLRWSEAKRHLVIKMLFFEVIVLVLLYFVRIEREKTKRKERQDQMMLDYSEVVSKLLILMGAGMSLKQSWNTISARYSDKRKKNEAPKRFIYEEMVYTNHEIQDGETELVAYQKFGERTEVGAYQRLVRILVQNVQIGSRGICQLLSQEAEDAMEERKALAKRMGEEAGTKMLFPLLLMLGIVFAIIMTPALLAFQI